LIIAPRHQAEQTIDQRDRRFGIGAGINYNAAVVQRLGISGLMPKAASSANIRPPTSPALFSVYPFLHFVDFIIEPATNLPARRAFPFLAPALQRPRVAAQHCRKTTLTDKSPLADIDLVASSGRRFRIGNRQRRGVRGRLVRLPLVLTRHRQRTVGLATSSHLICRLRRVRLGWFSFDVSPGTRLQIA
jgi:hypothetical protein